MTCAGFLVDPVVVSPDYRQESSLTAEAVRAEVLSMDDYTWVFEATRAIEDSMGRKIASSMFALVGMLFMVAISKVLFLECMEGSWETPECSNLVSVLIVLDCILMVVWAS